MYIRRQFAVFDILMIFDTYFARLLLIGSRQSGLKIAKRRRSLTSRAFGVLYFELGYTFWLFDQLQLH